MAQRGNAAIWQTAALAAAVRAGLVAYGEWQDARMDVKYTDVDYWVFTDAAAALAAGRSPYARATYRYTPALAALLLPGALVAGDSWGRALWGKFLFCAADIAVGLLVYAVVRMRVADRTRAARIVGALWLLNPMVFAISTRGNAEGLLALLVVGFLHALLCGRVFFSGLLLGLAVHLKIFPAIYAPAVAAFLLGGRRVVASPPAAYAAVGGDASGTASVASVLLPGYGNGDATLDPAIDQSDAGKRASGAASQMGLRVPNSASANTLSAAPSAAGVAHPSPLRQVVGAAAVRDVSLARRVAALLRFAAGGALGVGVPTALSLWLYGREYLEHAVLYHAVRRDHRHNFSPYFYVFYAGTSGADDARACLSLPAWLGGVCRAAVDSSGRLPDPTTLPHAELLVFVPQMLLLAAIGLKYGRRDLPLALFLSTFVFVALNKVVTSQYFVWHLCLLPAAYVSLPRASAGAWARMAAAWGAAQGAWLAAAYRLEFLGRPVFAPLWAASVAFLAVNAWIAGEVVRLRASAAPGGRCAAPGALHSSSALRVC